MGPSGVLRACHWPTAFGSWSAKKLGPDSGGMSSNLCGPATRPPSHDSHHTLNLPTCFTLCCRDQCQRQLLSIMSSGRHPFPGRLSAIGTFASGSQPIDGISPSSPTNARSLRLYDDKPKPVTSHIHAILVVPHPVMIDAEPDNRKYSKVQKAAAQHVPFRNSDSDLSSLETTCGVTINSVASRMPPPGQEP